MKRWSAEVSVPEAAHTLWALTVPELYVRELAASPQLRRVRAGEVVLPNITAHDAPGHTPGHLIFLLDGGGTRLSYGALVATDARGRTQPLDSVAWNPRGYCNNTVHRVRGRIG